MKRLTVKGAYNYLYENYGEVRHNMQAMVDACKILSKEYGVTPLKIFHFIVEQEPIEELYTHSYGFNTSSGRTIREEFEGYYYEAINNQC